MVKSICIMFIDFYIGISWCRDIKVSRNVFGGGDKKFKGIVLWGEREGERGVGKLDFF